MFIGKKKIILLASVILLTAVSCGKKPQAERQAGTDAKSSVSVEQVPDVKIIKATQVIYEGPRSVTTNIEQPAGFTALDALKLGAVVTGSPLKIESVDGVPADSKHFWALYVNGKLSKIGANDYLIKDGDKIEWHLDNVK